MFGVSTLNSNIIMILPFISFHKKTLYNSKEKQLSLKFVTNPPFFFLGAKFNIIQINNVTKKKKKNHLHIYTYTYVHIIFSRGKFWVVSCRHAQSSIPFFWQLSLCH